MHPRTTAFAAALLALTLASCSSGGASSGTTADSGSGEQVRIGLLGSAADTLDVSTATSSLPWAVAFNVFDSIALLSGDTIELQLAESVTPTDDATVWTIVLRDGVEFSDGTPVTADDALYSLRHLGTSANLSQMYGTVDWDNASSDGDRTVTLPMLTPSSGLLEEALAMVSVVFPEGTTDFTAPIGSGPYTVRSYSGDSGAVLDANPGYWGGEPQIDTVELVPVADADTRLTAVRDDQLDLALGISATGATTVADDPSIVVVDGGTANSSALSFTMNASVAPFDDPELRVALKQLVDRQQLVDVVLQGRGEVGNDVQGMGMPGYAEDLPQREQDVEAAREVFAAKGVTEVSILAAETIPGMLDAVRLLQQQLADIGVTLTINEVDPSTLYADMAAIYASPLFASYLINRPFASTVHTVTDPDSPFNFGRWDDPDYTAALRASSSLTDPDERAAAMDALQQTIWADGTDLLWGYQPVLSASTPALTGVTYTQSVPLLAEATLRP